MLNIDVQSADKEFRLLEARIPRKLKVRLTKARAHAVNLVEPVTVLV